MSDFDKFKQRILFLLLFVVIAPWFFLAEPDIVVSIGIYALIIIPFFVIWLVDYSKFKKSNFKTYEQYWHYHHNMHD
ncbi:hypothetical protein ERJ77_21215 [Vibrio anguillarum]|uniref:Uncharacterized protein n=1 Tax=Vibrio anguillarum TaxID=55601 RepID=A0AAW4BGP8_VIBAN|nr:hypothetical protein [Vibrio anguillarum]MBF4436961.1 hypothetical protein [Vibrio anguillarum]